MSSFTVCRTFILSAILTFLIVSEPATAQVTCPGSDPIVLDCNGNGTDDLCDIAAGSSADANTNGIPDECDFEVCFSNLCDGFDSATVGTGIDGTDCNGDGIPWTNASGSWTIGSGGCPANSGRSVKGVAQTPPITNEILQSEYFHTDEEGRLECTSARYKFTADFRSEAGLNPRIDWQIMLKDGSTGDPGTDPDVILIHLPSTQSSYPGVGTGNRGRMLVQNPDNLNGFLTLAPVFPIPANTCYRIEVELDNTAPAASAVKLYVNGTLRLTTKRLDPLAARIDYIYIVQEANGQAAGGTNRLALDNISVCEEGPALDWDDCNSDCVDDLVNVALPGGSDQHSPDCNASLVPDECENESNCSCDGPSVAHPCIWCNHKHVWNFETSDPDPQTEEIFVLGNIHGQRGWQASPVDGTDATVSATNPNGQLSGHTLRLGPVGFGSLGEAAKGPRSRSAAAADAPVEFWEVDVLLDTFDADKDIFFIIWDQCTDLTGQAQGDPPTSFDDPFTAGVRFVCDPGGANREVWLLDGSAAGLWRDQGANRSWSTNLRKHILIQLDNEINPPGTSYWANQHTHGFRETQSMFPIAIQNPAAGGSSEVMALSTSTLVTSYWDNFKYDRDTDCDCDGFPDSIWMTGGQFFRACHDLNNNVLPDWCEDCNHNGRLDSADIAGGTSLDCNLNGLPDSCDIDQSQPSCNHPGTVPPGGCIPGDDPQFWQLYSYRGGGSFDVGGPAGCAPDGIPDECQDDCNGNGLHDRCDIASGTSTDCNANQRPDSCDITGGTSPDCNFNAIPDSCDIVSGTSQDCQTNGVPDSCDITGGTSPDCNLNTIPDSCDIVSDASQDCQTNGVPDGCDITGGTSPDCNFNAIPDSCDIVSGTSQDCQANGVPDSCDISSGSSQDANGNGTPDECDVVPAATIVGAVSRKVHQPPPPLANCDIPINVAGRVADGNVTSEPRIGGITELRITFDRAPGPATPYPVTILQQTGCPPGVEAAFAAYNGVSLRGASLEGNTLVLTFQPGLENSRTYRFDLSPTLTSAANQFIEVRRLYGDVTGDGRVNAADRSAVVGIWTGPGFSCKTDLSVDSVTNAADRSAVVGAWTGGPTTNCAP